MKLVLISTAMNVLAYLPPTEPSAPLNVTLLYFKVSLKCPLTATENIKMTLKTNRVLDLSLDRFTECRSKLMCYHHGGLLFD